MTETVTRTAVIRIPNGTALATSLRQADGTFSAGAPLFMAGHIPTGLIFPAAWTAAVLTVQGSTDGLAWFDMFDRSGGEISFAAAASRFVVIEPSLITGTLFLRFRSGTSAAPVNQGADRDITVLFREFD